MRSRISFFVLIFTLSSFALPHLAHASIPFLGPIVPAEISQCAAGWGAAIVIINRIIEFSLTVAIVLVAPVTIAYAGFLLVMNQGNAGQIDKAKGIILNTVVGIVIALSAWLVVDAIMATLYNSGASDGQGSTWQAWSDLVGSNGAKLCIPLSDSLKQATNGGLIQGISANGDVTVVPPYTEPPEETAVRNQLQAAGVSINHPTACNPYNIDGVTYSCTNVGGMLPATVRQVINIKNSCGGCSVMVNGGSEAGHASSGQYSHGNGYKVDLALDSNLNTFLQKLPLTGQRGGDSSGLIHEDQCKNQYVQESNHWDITVFSVC